MPQNILKCAWEYARGAAKGERSAQELINGKIFNNSEESTNTEITEYFDRPNETVDMCCLFGSERQITEAS